MNEQPVHVLCGAACCVLRAACCVLPVLPVPVLTRLLGRRPLAALRAAAQVTRDRQEIIEFPYVVVDVRTGKIVHQEQHYIKPEYSKITEFCTKLTGIDEATVSQGCTLAHAVAVFIAHVENEIVAKGKTFALATHGTWDLLLQLRCECAIKSIELPTWMLRLLDLRSVYLWWAKCTANQPGASASKSSSLRNICASLDIRIHGRLHSGLDDSKTIANAMLAICGCACSDQERTQFPQPYDWTAEVEAFKAKGLAAVRVESMPYNCTEQEVAAWLQAHGLGPAEVVEVKRFMYPGNVASTGAAYLAFASTAVALKLLTAPIIPLGNMSVFVRPLNDLQRRMDEASSHVTWVTFKTGFQPVTEALLSFPAAADAFAGGSVLVTNLYWHVTRQDIEAWCVTVFGERPTGLAYHSDAAGKFAGVVLLTLRSPDLCRRALAPAARDTTICDRPPTVRPVEVEEVRFLRRIGRWEEMASLLECECSGLRSGIQSAQLERLFARWGAVRRCMHYADLETRCGSGRAKIVFDSIEAVEQVLLDSAATTAGISFPADCTHGGAPHPAFRVHVSRAAFNPAGPQEALSICVSNLHKATLEDELEDVFGQFCDVHRCGSSMAAAMRCDASVGHCVRVCGCAVVFGFGAAAQG